MIDLRRQPPSMLRNREPILAVLMDVLPKTGLVLEIASGSGGHAAWFAKHLPGLAWQPSERYLDDDDRRSFDGWAEWAATDGLRKVITLDVEDTDWLVQAADAMVCINMVHISPWQTTLALLAGAGRILGAGGALVLYGPYMVDGVPTAAGNLAFDSDLRQRNPAWGVRHLDAVCAAAAEHGLNLEQTVDMPSNNLCVIFRR